jgi:hypothetical protein
MESTENGGALGVGLIHDWIFHGGLMGELTTNNASIPQMLTT